MHLVEQKLQCPSAGEDASELRDAFPDSDRDLGSEALCAERRMSEEACAILALVARKRRCEQHLVA